MSADIAKLREAMQALEASIVANAATAKAYDDADAELQKTRDANATARAALAKLAGPRGVFIRWHGSVLKIGRDGLRETIQVIDLDDAPAVPVHNPDRLTYAQVGFDQGYRLLDTDEILSHISIGLVEMWSTRNQEWSNPCMAGHHQTRTYRTRLSRADLAQARKEAR